MPSWVPGWTIKTAYRPFLVSEDILDTTYSFNATLRMLAPKHAEVSDDSKILTVQGVIFDTVHEIGIERIKSDTAVTKGTLDHLRQILPPENIEGNIIVAAKGNLSERTRLD